MNFLQTVIIHSWLVTIALQLAVLKIIILKSYYGYRIPSFSTDFFAVRKVVSYITITIAKLLHGSTYESLSPCLGS